MLLMEGCIGLLVGLHFQFLELVGYATDISLPLILKSAEDEVLQILNFVRSENGFCERAHRNLELL